MKKNILSFEEAITLMHVGAHGFKFQSQRGDTFAVELDHNDRLKIDLVTEEEKVEWKI